METEIFVALLSLCGTLAGSFAGIITSGKLTNYRITELEKKVEKAPERKNTRDFGTKTFIRGTEVYKKGLSSGKKGGKNKR